MEEEQNQTEYETPIVKVEPQGLPSWGGFTIAFLALLLGMTLGHFVSPKEADPSPQCVATNENQKAQAEVNKAAMLAQAALQKRLETLQMKVADSCVAKGDVPIWTGNNIDCKGK